MPHFLVELCYNLHLGSPIPFAFKLLSVMVKLPVAGAVKPGFNVVNVPASYLAPVVTLPEINAEAL